MYGGVFCPIILYIHILELRTIKLQAHYWFYTEKNIRPKFVRAVKQANILVNSIRKESAAEPRQSFF